MELMILDDQFQLIRIVEDYISFIWTERFLGYGDFEVVLVVAEDTFDFVKQNYYAQIKDSDCTMIIEEIELTSDVENGITVRVSGRSLESILDRRIVWSQKNFSGNIQTVMQTLLNDSIINPSDPDRKISNFSFRTVSSSYISGITMTAQYTGDNIYDIITNICDECDLGYQIILDSSNNFVFFLTEGVDRSYDQTDVPWVIFSPKYDNLSNIDYLESDKALKNVTHVLGEDQGSARKEATVGTETGLLRRELYTDARDIQSEEGESASSYTAKLTQRGEEKLVENQRVETFEGDIDSRTNFIYKRDYNIGDIVQIDSGIGLAFKVRITEIIRSMDSEGYKLYPTFIVVG